MSYRIDAGNIKQARAKADRLYSGLMEIKYAKESIQMAVNAMMRAADELGQPESDIARSYVDDLEAMLTDMEKRRRDWVSNRKALCRGIDAFGKKQKGGNQDG